MTLVLHVKTHPMFGRQIEAQGVGRKVDDFLKIYALTK